MGNTTRNTFNQKGANAEIEYKGFKIKNTNGRKGFHIVPSAGELSRELKGQWLRQEVAKQRIDAYLADPARQARAEKAATRKARAADTNSEDKVNAEGDSK